MVVRDGDITLFLYEGYDWASTRKVIEDEVKNYGAYDQEFQIIYHSNYGPPLLEAGSRFVAAAKEVRPFNAHAAKSLNQFAEYGAPTKGFIEQVYGVIPFADENNRATVMLRNAAGGLSGMASTHTSDFAWSGPSRPI